MSSSETATKKVPRKQLILESLAAELERSPGERITTAALARAVGVSEAALYRHFASKAKMFEGLIEFAEEAVFARINQILDDEKGTRQRCARCSICCLVLPNVIRVLPGSCWVMP